MAMLQSLFKGSKTKKCDQDKDASDRNSDRSSRRSMQNSPRLERAKNLRGLRIDSDYSVDTSRSSNFDLDHSLEVVRSPSPGLQPTQDIDLCLPPLSLNKASVEKRAQGISPISSSHSCDGDMEESEGTAGYLSDSASSDSSVQAKTGYGIFSIYTGHPEGDQNGVTVYLSSPRHPGSPLAFPSSPRLIHGNGKRDGGLHIHIHVDRPLKSAPTSTLTSPLPSPRASSTQESPWLWNPASSSQQQASSPAPDLFNDFMLQQRRPNSVIGHGSPHHSLSSGAGALPLSDVHPLPLPPALSRSSNASATSMFSTSSSLVPPRSPTRADSGGSSGKWQKGALLGSGAFGRVYKGIHSETGEFCAIKEVEYVKDDEKARESVKQLAQEIMLLSSLRHPNIVHYKGSEMVDGFLYIYLELVSGGSIYKVSQEFKKLEERVIRRYTRQILQGLHFLHSRNTVHRDIKGANILVDQEGTVKLADFGMAKQINEQGANLLSFKGSPYWMAPEVIMQKNTGYELAIDIWSLGCTVMEMVTGRPPWSEYEGVAAMFKVTRAEIPPIPDTLSREGQSFIRLCLQRNPADRPTAAALLEHPFVQIGGDGPELILHPITISESLSSELGVWQENSGGSTGLVRGGSQPSNSRPKNGGASGGSTGSIRGGSHPTNNSRLNHGSSRTSILPSRSAPVSPRSSNQDLTDLAHQWSADQLPGFSTPPPGSPRVGSSIHANYGEVFDRRSRTPERKSHVNQGLPTSVHGTVMGTNSNWDNSSANRQSPHHYRPRSGPLYGVGNTSPHQYRPRSSPLYGWDDMRQYGAVTEQAFYQEDQTELRSKWKRE